MKLLLPKMQWLFSFFVNLFMLLKSFKYNCYLGNKSSEVKCCKIFGSYMNLKVFPSCKGLKCIARRNFNSGHWPWGHNTAFLIPTNFRSSGCWVGWSVMIGNVPVLHFHATVVVAQIYHAKHSLNHRYRILFYIYGLNIVRLSHTTFALDFIPSRLKSEKYIKQC